jgi:hypothetical protein
MLSRFVLYVLLLALLTSLGDGPFVDEVIAAETQQEQALSPQGVRDDAARGSSVVLVYATLMNACGLGSHPANCPVAVHHGVPRYAAPLYASPPPALPQHPPRATFL